MWKQAKSECQLKIHQQLLNVGKRYQCDECDYQAKQKSILTKHQNSVHMEISVWWVLKTVFREEYLTKHHQTVHMGMKYPGEKCDIQFTQRSSFTNINNQFTWVRKIHMRSVENSLQRRATLPNINNQFTWIGNIYMGSVSTRLHVRANLPHINS